MATIMIIKQAIMQLRPCNDNNNYNNADTKAMAIIAAVTTGTLEDDRVKSWKKMQREQRYQEAARDQRLMSNIKKEYKQLAKRVRASQKKGIF